MNEITTEQLQREVLINQLKSKHNTNHILHVILSVITLGWWVPVWILITINNAIERGRAERVALGKTYVQRLGRWVAKNNGWE